MHQSIYLLTAVKSKLVKTVNLDELTKFAQLCSHKTQKLTKRPPPPNLVADIVLCKEQIITYSSLVLFEELCYI